MNNNRENNKHDVKCSYCRKRVIIGYRFKCVECHDYDLCDRCFGKRRCNYSHELHHKMVRYDEPDVLFGKRLSSDEVNLKNLKSMYKNETHVRIKCNICGTEPIKGLRFKCDTCTDFNLCEGCVNQSSGRHSCKTHPVLLICKSISHEIDYSKIEFVKELGSGAFGRVYEAKYEKRTVACKIIEAEKFISTTNLSGGTIKLPNDSYDELFKSYLRELNAYNEIKSDNILRMIGYCTTKTTNYRERFVILTEYMEKGNLERVITNEPDLSYRVRLSMAADVAAGMFKIHKIGFIHRDIRPANILVNSNYVAKIGDMGIAKLFEVDAKFGQTVIGYRPFMPPEFDTGSYTQKLDVFTFGLTLNELFKGSHSARGGNIRISKKCELIYDDFVRAMVRYDPNDRPTSKEIENKLFYIKTSVQKKLEENVEYMKAQIERRNKIFEEYYKIEMTNYNDKQLQEEERIRKEDALEVLVYFKHKQKNLEKYTPKSRLIPQYLRIICSIYFGDGNRQKCFEYLNKLLEKTKEICPGNNIENADALSSAGLIFFKLFRETKKAIEYYNKALEMRKSLQIEKDPSIAKDYYHLGKCLQDVNQFNEALNAHLESLERKKKIYDSKNKYIVDSLIAIQECYLALNNIDEYLKYHREEVNIKKELFVWRNAGEKYKHLQLICESGMCYYVLIEDEKRFEELMRSETKTPEKIKECGKVVLMWENNGKFSETFRKQTENKYSIEFDSKFKQEFRIDGTLVKDLIDDTENDRDAVLKCLYDELNFIYDLNNGQENVYFVKDLLLIAEYYLNQLNDSFTCLLFATKAREISMRIFDSSEFDYSIQALSYIAACLMLNNPKQALEEHLKLLEIKKSVYGETHPTIASSYESIGKCYFELSDFKKAVENYLIALKMRKKLHDGPNKYTVNTLKRIVECYDILDESDNYLKYHREVVAMSEELTKNKKPGKVYRDVVLIRNKEKEDPSWHYVLIENLKKFEECRKTMKIGNLKNLPFGRVLKSGWGYNPTRNITNQFEKQYESD